MKIYKVVSSSKGFKELEKTVSMMLNAGWECAGGIAFNQGYCYQAMTTTKPATGKVKPPTEEREESKPSSFIDAARRIDELT